jgi:glutamate-ammonia-ligase adenylyltransferase
MAGACNLTEKPNADTGYDPPEACNKSYRMHNDLAFVTSLSISALPEAANRDWLALGVDEWHQMTTTAADTALGRAAQAALDLPQSRRWLEAIFGNSPFLTRLALRDPEVTLQVLSRGPEHTFAELLDGLNREHTATTANPGQTVPPETKAVLMRRLRIARRHAALIIAMADLAAIWPLERVTGALSRFAEHALSEGLCHLLRAAAAAGQLRLAHPESPERDSGIIILGMGKLGASELNYSSDIDLIVFYDSELIRIDDPDKIAPLMARITRELMAIIEERTADGYVFRTDLRLRPDPGSTPPAVSLDAAAVYYASLGQNWERAAMIKARPVAGDLEAGKRFMHMIGPFIWRKHLDFAAIQDILSIKRQIDARHGGSREAIAGYNIKLGHGGIREIEFFAQTQQLIWGGRIPALRCNGTIEALEALVACGRIDARVAGELAECYDFLRQVEHRLQMIDDRQTHSLPTQRQALEHFAGFMGFASLDLFETHLRQVLTTVQRHFRLLSPTAPQLSAGGNLVFTGKDDDPETLDTLASLGFENPAQVAEIIRGWHHGRIRATRSQRARELLTELVPEILRLLGATAHPNYALARFDEFLSRLPAGVQLFSLFRAHPELLELVSEIMGDAPGLAVRLSRKPLLLDAVLTGDFFTPLPTEPDAARGVLTADLERVLALARDYQDVLDLTRRWTGDHKFRLGVQHLQARIDATLAGVHFTALAETVIAALLPRVVAELAKTHGVVPGGAFSVLALGKTGSREMTAASDLDLVFVYDVDAAVEQSDGPKPLAVSSYYARLSQRLINALTATTSEGGLYEVDMRLRPSGAAGPIASSLDSFARYHAEQAWTWEFMALSRARVVAGDAALGQTVSALVERILTRPRDPDRLLADVADMRHRIIQQHPHPSAWDWKQRRGGLIDIEFISQYLLLRHAPEHPGLLAVGTAEILRGLADAGLLDHSTAATLIEALALWRQIHSVLRVALDATSAGKEVEEPVERLMARATGIADPQARLDRINRTADDVFEIYDALVERPAAALPLPTEPRGSAPP